MSYDEEDPSNNRGKMWSLENPEKSDTPYEKPN